MTIFSGKRHFVLFIALLLFVCCAYAQETASAKAAPAQADETAIYLDAPAQGTAAVGSKPSSSPSSIWILIRIIVVLALVCAGIYGVVYLLKKSTKIDVGNDPFLKSVASLSVGPNRSVQILTAGEKAFMVGITENSINLISEITDKELIDAMSLESAKKAPVPGGNFAALLARILPRKPAGDALGATERAAESGGSESAFATADFLRKQRERLSGSSPDGSGRGFSE
jgi:flagellar protein FliO/FliZ